MSKYELPPEAERVLAKVDAAEARIDSLRERFAKDVERVRAGFADEGRRHARDVAVATKRLEEREREFELDRAAFYAIVEERVRGIAFVADAWAEYEEARAEAQAEALRTKSHPALAASEAVATKGRELAAAIRRAKLAEWTVRLYENAVPSLAELSDKDEHDGYVDAPEHDVPADVDPVLGWLAREEYDALPPAERNQRALCRYLARRKTRWQIGRDFEQFVGYLRERDGFVVTYHGIAKGLEDLGRDLVARRGDEIEVIQCKRWSASKTIHEKHIFQLYGTVVLAQIENPGLRISGTFTTTTSLSEVARAVAERLGLRVEERLPLGEFPRIKCNIARDSGERIYHLPFDQQYDKTVIEPERGEVCVHTAAEAESLGFRRAFRWKGAR